MARRWVVGLGILVLLVVLLGSVALARVRNGPGLPTGERTVSGLGAPVDVVWDSAGIPHIFASSVEDAFRAQGMAHAHHRLWQIEFFRRVATGRLAEMLGEPALASDRFLRTLGMGRVARRAEALLDAETRGFLEAYVEGLNHAIETWSGPLPPEFLVLGVRPEPFEVADVLAIERIMAWDLTQYDDDLLHAELLDRLSPRDFERVRKRYPEGGTTIVGNRRTAAPTVEPAPDVEARPSVERTAEREGAAVDLLRTAAAPEELRPVMRAVTATHASNAWVIGGARTVSGMPIVANDMHLGLVRPALFYLVGLHAPGYDVVGMSIPGAPGIAAGRAGGVAWGYTNAGVDDADFFVERVDPSDTTRYLTPEGSAPFQVHVERIDVRGRTVPDSILVRETRHGPIMTPVEASLGGELVSLRWVAHSDSSTLPALFAMNRAPDATSFLDALRDFRTISQNVVFADTAGAWGYWMAGRVPLRDRPRPPIAAMDGRTGDGDWRGYLPFDEHPHEIAPARGFVVTANNRQQADSIGDLVSNDMWSLPWRADRITQRIEEVREHDVASVHDIQMDVLTLRGARYADVASEGFRDAGDAEAAARIETWDGRATRDGREASLFQAWFEGVREQLRNDVYGVGATGYVDGSAVDRWIDGGLPEGVASRAAAEALERVGPIAWGEQHYLHLDHPLASVPLLQRLFGFARTGIPVPGTGVTIDVAGYAVDADGRYRVTWGASQRHVSDLSEDAAWFILPGGQSGYPGGAHSADQIPAWLDGGLMRLPLTRQRADERAIGTWRLVPG